MVLPHSYNSVLLLMILSLVCWGSWANFYKLAGKWRFELFYFDFAIGMMLIALICGFSLGNLGFDGFDFTDDLMNSGKREWLYGFTAAMIFNFANMLITAAISVGGMAMAFPVGYAVAFAVAALLGWVANPHASGSLLLAGGLLLLFSVIANAIAYARVNVLRHEAQARAGTAKSTMRPSSMKGLILAAVGGLLMGMIAPLLLKAQNPDLGMGPYALTVIFGIGVVFSSFVLNLFFMNLPVEGDPLEIMEYFHGSLLKHLLGILGGMMWGGGAVAYFAATTPKGSTHLDGSLGDLLAHAPPLLAALWGLLVWREFKGGDFRVKAFAFLSVLLLAGGAIALTLAPHLIVKP